MTDLKNQKCVIFFVFSFCLFLLFSMKQNTKQLSLKQKVEKTFYPFKIKLHFYIILKWKFKQVNYFGVVEIPLSSLSHQFYISETSLSSGHICVSFQSPTSEVFHWSAGLLCCFSKEKKGKKGATLFNFYFFYYTQ